MAGIFIARTMQGLTSINTLVFSIVSIRFQITPGTENGLGIEGVNYSILSSGTVRASGHTDPNGQVFVPLFSLMLSPSVLRIFGTDYNLQIHAGLQAINT